MTNVLHGSRNLLMALIIAIRPLRMCGGARSPDTCSLEGKVGQREGTVLECRALLEGPSAQCPKEAIGAPSAHGPCRVHSGASTENAQATLSVDKIAACGQRLLGLGQAAGHLVELNDMNDVGAFVVTSLC